jgi:hypothetical protein
MAKDINLDAISKSDGRGAQLQGHISREDRKPLKPVFEPMRRKMHVPGM